MPFTHVYQVPDYYPNFICKGAECRHTCCKGWNATLSFKEYFKLMGLSCSKKLKNKIDIAFTPADHQDKERYYIIKHNWEGNCPLVNPDGLCSLHNECGEKALPAICRYYPRAARTNFAYECSCTGSCEKVLEMLLSQTNKIEFVDKEVTFDLEEPIATKDIYKIELYKKIRTFIIERLQDRTLPLNIRLYRIGLFMKEANEMSLKLLTEKFDELASKHNEVNECHYKYKIGIAGFAIQRKIAEWFENNSISFSEYTKAIEDAFTLEGEYSYKLAREKFQMKFPKEEIFFENMLTNHIYYEQFPFIEGYTTLWDSFLGLCGVYSFLRYIAFGYMLNKESVDELVDVCGAAFRVIEHSNFYAKINIMLRTEGCAIFETVMPLINS